MAQEKKTKDHHRERPHAQTLAERVEIWLGAHSVGALVFCLVVGLALALLNFELKPGIGGDDTSYVLSALRFVRTGEPTVGFRTPGYPLVLAFFVWIVGAKLTLLKMTSLVFFLGLIASFWMAFRTRLEPLVFYPALLIVAINPLVLEYSSQTYSEMLFALFCVLSFHFLLRTKDTESVKPVILAALMTVLGFYIRIPGAMIGAAALVTFVSERRWKAAGLFILFCAAFYAPYKIYEWTHGLSGFSQASLLLLKNPYNATEGNETFGGFLARFLTNFINQLNYQVPVALGLPHSEDLAQANGAFLPNEAAALGILFSLVTLTGILVSIFKESYSRMRPVGIFLVLYVGFICFSLQNVFATPRMMMPVVAYCVVMFLVGLRYLALRATGKGDDAMVPRARSILAIGAAFILLSNIAATRSKTAEHYPVLKANLAGNEFAGFTEDWINYIQASRWIGQTVPREGSNVVCRKPEIFQLYADGYKALGVYQIDETNPDSIVEKWRSNGVTHLLYDTFQWSGTLRRYIQPVAVKYPGLFVLLHQEGSTFPSYVFRIAFDSLSHAVPPATPQKN